MRASRLLGLVTALGMAAVLAPASRPLIAASETVGVWVTTGDRSQLLAPQPSLVFAPDTSTRRYLTIDVDAETQATTRIPTATSASRSARAAPGPPTSRTTSSGTSRTS